jgi:magnesium-transporting ATPase (P-type)
MNGNTTGISCSEVTLKNLSEDETQQLVCKTSVFARATPDDKLIILKTLQGFKKCVMATGDGM